MKKLYTSLLALSLILGAAACSNDDSSKDKDSSNDDQSKLNRKIKHLMIIQRTNRLIKKAIKTIKQRQR